MSTKNYLDLFFPFDKPDVVKKGIESMWNISNDRVGFCSPQCKNKHNVSKSRAKDKSKG